MPGLSQRRLTARRTSAPASNCETDSFDQLIVAAAPLFASQSTLVLLDHFHCSSPPHIPLGCQLFLFVICFIALFCQNAKMCIHCLRLLIVIEKFTFIGNIVTCPLLK